MDQEAEAVRAAARALRGRVHRTPCVRSTALGDSLGVELWFKAECLQKTGSFKVRGVLTRLAALDDDERRRGLVSMSAGNHAAALAWAARDVGSTATIVMPERAVASKVAATERYGGRVVLTGGDLMAECEAVGARTGAVFVHPFDDDRVMAGHGTVGLEILEAVPRVDVVVVPVGGGGLIGGVATAIKTARPGVRVVGVEPAGAAAMTESLAAGAPRHLERANTIADGLAAPFAGARCLERVRRYVDDVVTVDDDAIARALLETLSRTKLAVEPSAAAPLAALLAGRLPVPCGATVVCVASGGNLDPGVLRGIIGR